jgi:hypothetical protein
VVPLYYSSNSGPLPSINSRAPPDISEEASLRLTFNYHGSFPSNSFVF